MIKHSHSSFHWGGSTCSTSRSPTAKWVIGCQLYKWNSLHQAVVREWKNCHSPDPPSRPSVPSAVFWHSETRPPIPQDVGLLNQLTTSCTVPQCLTVPVMWKQLRLSAVCMKHIITLPTSADCYCFLSSALSNLRPRTSWSSTRQDNLHFNHCLHAMHLTLDWTAKIVPIIKPTFHCKKNLWESLNICSLIWRIQEICMFLLQILITVSVYLECKKVMFLLKEGVLPETSVWRY